ncbi:MAG: tetratricopeptide repeat protein, partial [Myxococcota bacterium]
AAARPDAFLPDLAMSLNNLGAMLSDLGRREEALAAAEEGVAITLPLARKYSRTSGAMLRSLCDNVEATLAALGRAPESSGSLVRARALLKELDA